jgi:hypothetical protein
LNAFETKFQSLNFLVTEPKKLANFPRHINVWRVIPVNSRQSPEAFLMTSQFSIFPKRRQEDIKLFITEAWVSLRTGF